MFRQSELTGEKLGMAIKRLLADTKHLAAMAENSGKIAKPGATETIVNGIMELLKERLEEDTGKILAF